jgi:hypothetical protein
VRFSRLFIAKNIKKKEFRDFGTQFF